MAPISQVANVGYNTRVDVHEKRLINLRRLLEREKSVAAFARKVATEAPYVFQILAGRNNVGDELAKKIEAAYGQARGWLDELEEDRRRAALSEESIVLAQAIERLPPEQRTHLRALVNTLAQPPLGRCEGES